MSLKEGIADMERLILQLPEGKQKEYFQDIAKRLKKGEKVNPADFIAGMDNKDFDVDIAALREKDKQVNEIYKQWVKR